MSDLKQELIRAFRTYADSREGSFGEKLAIALIDLLAVCTEETLGTNEKEREVFVQQFYSEFEGWMSFYPRAEKLPVELKVEGTYADPTGTFADKTETFAEDLSGVTIYETKRELAWEDIPKENRATYSFYSDTVHTPAGSMYGRVILSPGVKCPGCACHGSVGFGHYIETSSPEEFQRLTQQKRVETDHVETQRKLRWNLVKGVVRDE